MLKTTLWSREVNGYNNEESDQPEVKVFHQLRWQKFWLWTSTGPHPLPRSITASYQGPQSRGSEKSQGLTVFPWTSPLRALFSERDSIYQPAEIMDLVAHGKDREGGENADNCNWTTLKKKEGHPCGARLGLAAPYLSGSHLSFSSWLCSNAENKKKRMTGWDSFLSLVLGNSDIYSPRIMSLWENQAHFN